MEHTKQHIQKPFWYVFSFFWSRWIIFSRIDVWPLNLFMCIFDKIPITFFKFPSISSFFCFSIRNIHHFVKMRFYWMFRKFSSLTISKPYLLSVIPDISIFDKPTILQTQFCIIYYFMFLWGENMRFDYCNLLTIVNQIDLWGMH